MAINDHQSQSTKENPPLQLLAEHFLLPSSPSKHHPVLCRPPGKVGEHLSERPVAVRLGFNSQLGEPGRSMEGTCLIVSAAHNVASVANLGNVLSHEVDYTVVHLARCLIGGVDGVRVALVKGKLPFFLQVSSTDNLCTKAAASSL